jgi:serine O-acetyltransferase
MLKTLRNLAADIDSIRARDPAARSTMHVMLAYPGVHALFLYRLANWCWRHRLIPVAIGVSYLGRFLTGIEIHPGACIGRGFFIDHGHGVVIGETAEIGDDVTLYHGVTLGGTSLHKGKRHPTLKNGVIVGAGAQILGPVTLHEKARIGSNAVVLHDVPPDTTMVGIPAKPLVSSSKEGATAAFDAYGLSSASSGECDPMMGIILQLTEEIHQLRQKISKIEQKTSPPDSF